MNLNNFNLPQFLKNYSKIFSNERDMFEYISSNKNLLTSHEIKSLKKINFLTYLTMGIIGINTFSIFSNQHFSSFFFWFVLLLYNCFLLFFFPRMRSFLSKDEYSSHLMKYALKPEVKFFIQQHEAIFYSVLNEMYNKKRFIIKFVI